MLHTGIIRRVDDLGRIVIPKEIRRRAGIAEGTPVEIMMEKDTIVLRKYPSVNLLSGTLQILETQIEDYLSEDSKLENLMEVRKHINAVKALLNEENK
jgi:AbrB family looped-hinge helix DNA binding protein